MMDLFLTNTEFFTLIDVKVIWWTGVVWIITFTFYIYAFSRRFYPKRLTITFRLYIFISKCVPWESNPQPFALLTQCSATKPHRNTVIVMFWSSVWTLILTAPIHCRASIGEQVMERYISVLMKKQTHLYLGWPFSANLYSGVRCTFKVQWAMLHTFFKLYLWHFSPIICWKTSTIWNNAVLKKQTTNHRLPQWMAN